MQQVHSRPTEGRPAPSRAISRTDLPTVILHWALVATLAISVSTGLRIAADDGAPTWRAWLEPLLMEGQVSQWHVLSALAFVAIVAGYVFFLRRSDQTSRLAVYRAALKAADHRARWSARNRLIYWVALALLAVITVTGVLMYYLPGLLPNRLITTIHQIATWGLLLYVLAHVLGQLVLGGWRQLLKIVNPRWAYAGAAALALAGAGALALATGALDAFTVGDLHMARIASATAPQGMPAQDQWQQAKPMQIHTTHGANFPGGEATVTVRALHDEKYAYFQYEWADSTHSRKHLPLVKTEQGWKLLNDNYWANNETQFYEDKFAVLLANTSAIAGGTANLGSNPLPGKPAPANGRGMHFTTDGSLADMWHWKANRTGMLKQIDDNFFGPALQPEDGKRYTGGYGQDKKSAGGYDTNWKRIDKTDFITPKRLPKDWAALRERMGPVSLDPNVSEQGVFHMWDEETVAYSKELDDAIPVGTVMPSVLHSKPFEGDRGDVTANGVWRDGRWRLEIRRPLDTQSKSDLQIKTGVYMWVAAFNHAQTQHTRHMRPLRIVLD
ncbi:MAG: ethylbenzene dehydrogenase-related protein [Polaromonas sp.]